MISGSVSNETPHGSVTRGRVSTLVVAAIALMVVVATVTVHVGLDKGSLIGGRSVGEKSMAIQKRDVDEDILPIMIIATLVYIVPLVAVGVGIASIPAESDVSAAEMKDLPFTKPRGYPCVSPQLAASIALASYKSSRAEALDIVSGRSGNGWGGCPRCTTVGNTYKEVKTTGASGTWSGDWWAWAFFDTETGNLFIGIRGSSGQAWNYPGNVPMLAGKTSHYQNVIDAFGGWIGQLEATYGAPYAIIGHSAGGFFSLRVPSKSTQTWRITFNAPASFSGRRIMNFRTAQDEFSSTAAHQHYMNVGSGTHTIHSIGPKFLGGGWTRLSTSISGAHCSPILIERKCGTAKANHGPATGKEIATTRERVTEFECAGICQANAHCDCFTWGNGQCKEYEKCGGRLVARNGLSSAFCRKSCDL